ncbi:MAG: phosphate ABC transporter permease subunit PstC [Chloroflexi bacterium]|nr:phosphate ABC transporter permease subunit PstC [Chloroflexota bacterium]
MAYKSARLMDRGVKGILLAAAFLAVAIVFTIGLFILRQALPAFSQIGVFRLLSGTEWRPSQSIFGLLPMILGSLLVTLGAIVMGVPLALGCAILMAEIAPRSITAVIRPAVQLLGGIPSVVFGLFGMRVLVPLIRQIPVPSNTGFSILAASIVLAVMILPTITTVSEDAIRAVSGDYRDASLALGATKWQTIVGVVLPAARSGIVASVVLGIGRALGETMAMIMVIGNSVIIPQPLNDNPLTILLSQARTLTGNIAVEIGYSSGLQTNALYATGVVLFLLTILINSLAHALVKERAI